MKILNVARKEEIFEVIVDNDFPDIKVWIDSKGYAFVYQNKKKVGLHRFLMNAPQGVLVDHKDGDPLNNQRENLRLCTRKENGANQKRKGFCWVPSRSKWKAKIKVDGKNIFLGYFSTEEAAQEAYRTAHKEYFGEFSPW